MADFPIVGIGSSAGGPEALRQLFEAMPPDGGLAFVVAAHLDPTRESHLSELLSRCTKMPVAEIENSVKVEPNRVYVIAPDQELMIRQGVIRSNKPTAPRDHRHRSIRSSARTPRIKASGQSRSFSPGPAPTARSACASSRPKVAS